MNQSPEEEENKYLSDKRINDLVRKQKRNVWFAAIPAVIGAYAAGYLNQLWLLLPSLVCILWILRRK